MVFNRAMHSQLYYENDDEDGYCGEEQNRHACHFTQHFLETDRKHDEGNADHVGEAIRQNIISARAIRRLSKRG